MSATDKFKAGDLVEVSGVLAVAFTGVVVRDHVVPWPTPISYYVVYVSGRQLGWIPQHSLKKLA